MLKHFVIWCKTKKSAFLSQTATSFQLSTVSGYLSLVTGGMYQQGLTAVA